MPATTAEPTPASTRLDQELAGLDALEIPDRPRAELARRVWSAVWPKVAAIFLALLIWQAVVWSGWKPTYVLPPPGKVLREFWTELTDGTFTKATRITLQRAFIGYSLALVIGVVVGALVSRNKILRSAFGSLITGLQTMPSIAWFPLAILLFKISESAILFVVVLGAAPAIANGLISGADNIQPILLRAGRVLGAKRWTLYRHVVLPASLPSFVGGMKQGWAFAWRSLMAGELLVVIANQPSIGFLLDANRQLADAEGLIAVMILILIIGILVDSVFFGTLERKIRKRYGLVDAAAN
jgi:NitT/TauT family transport system permease protein